MSDSNHQQFIGPWKIITVCVIIAILLYIQSMTLGRGNAASIGVVLLLPWLLLLSGRCNTCFVLALGLYNSWLFFPGIPGSMSLFYVVALASVGLMFLSRLLKVPSSLPVSRTSVLILGYLAVVLVTMYMRGFSLRATGSESWGGKSYIELIIVILLYISSGVVVLSPRQCRTLIVLYFCLSLLPSIAELVYVLSRGTFPWLYAVIARDDFSASSSLIALGGGRGILRFQLLRNFGNLFLLSLALFPFRGRGKVIITITCLVGFAAAGLSGHRSSVLYLLLIIPTLFGLRTGKVPFRLLRWYAVGLLCLFVFLFVAGRHLPLSIQRAFAWVPFVEIDWLAKHSATESLEWRLRVWDRALRYLPDHWLVGRGFVYNATTFYNTRWHPDAHIEWAVVTHAYHSGPLSMLLDLGIGGLLCGIGTMFSGIVQHVKQARMRWASPHLERYFHVFLASLIVNVFRFLVVYGDASASMVLTLVHLTVLTALWRADREVAREQEHAIERGDA